MSIVNVRFGLLLTALALALPAWAEENLEGVEQKLAAASDQIKSVSFKLTTTADMKFEGGSSKRESVTTYDYLRTGANVKFRAETKDSSVTQLGDREMKQEATILAICDGEFVYSMTDRMGQKQAAKTNPDPSQSIVDFKSGITALRKSYDLKLMPDEKLDGKDTYVIEATPKTADDSPLSKLVLCFAKDLGLALKTTAYGKEGQLIATSLLIDVKLSPDFPADRFVFKAPEGVTVKDMTKSAAPSAPSTREATSQAEKPQKPDKTSQPAPPEKP
jgi:outer membrane lipoprotein-sorting protein